MNSHSFENRIVQIFFEPISLANQTTT